MYDVQINSHLIRLILVYISNWKRVKLVLGCSPFEQRHTGELMAGFVEDVCESWGIRSKVNILCGVRLSVLHLLPLKVDGLCTDTASNMTTMMTHIADMLWNGCLNHIIQLVVNVSSNFFSRLCLY